MRGLLGNLLSDGARTFVYDTANRLKQVANGTFTTTYTYAGDGTRLAQTVNGAITRYVVDVSGEMPQVLEERRVGHTTRYLHGLGGSALETDGGWAYYLADALGSARQAADAAGHLTLAQSYAPFGEPLASAGQPAGSFGFAGEQRDAAAGLIYLRNRYYDPAIGRFLTRDVYPALATVPQSLHAYVYCGNDPINRTDPSGQWWWDDWANSLQQAWYGFNDWSWDAQHWLDSRWANTERKITNWQTDPRREVAKVLTTAGKSVSDYSLRKRAELTKDVRTVTDAWEKGNKDVAIGQGAVYMLHLTGLTDIRLTRNLIAGQAARINDSIQHFNYNRDIALRAPIGSREWNRAAGEMTFSAFDLATRGAMGDLRYGAQQGDYLRAAAGLAQIIPGAEGVADTLDLAVAGRETYRGLRSGNAAQVEMGLFSAVVNIHQLGSGGTDVASALERPMASVRDAHLLSDVTGRVVGSFVPGGELLVEGGRQVAEAAGGLGRRAAGAIWESVNDQSLGVVHGSTRQWLQTATDGADVAPNRALVPYDAGFAEWQTQATLAQSRERLGIPETGKPNSLVTKIRDWAYGYNLDPRNYESWTIRSGQGGVVLGRGGEVLPDGWYMYVVDRNNRVRYLPTSPTPTSNKPFEQYRAHTQLAGGGNVWGAGAFQIVNGRFAEVNTGSGHYRPTPNYLAYTEEVLQTQGFYLETATFTPFKAARPWYHPRELERLGRDLAGATMAGSRRLLGLSVNEERPVPPPELRHLLRY